MTKQDQIANILLEYTRTIDRASERLVADRTAESFAEFVKDRVNALSEAKQKLIALGVLEC